MVKKDCWGTDQFGMQTFEKEEPSRKKETRKPQGSTVTSCVSSETLQPFLYCAVRKVQDIFISARDSAVYS